MGNDGGSIPTRRELVRNAARNPNTTEVKASQFESQNHAWTYCPLSQRPLVAPIVSDCTGTLYNKDAVIEFLLPSDDRASTPPKIEFEEIVTERIKSLRDTVEVKFQTEKDVVTKDERRICPITSKELGPNNRAVYLVPCGHAFSEAAIREVPSDACIQCNEGYKSDDIIPILPISKADIASLASRITKLKDSGLTHSLKKVSGGKKKKKGDRHDKKEEQAEPAGDQEINPRSELLQTQNTKKRLAELGSAPQSRSGTATPSSGIKNAATASLTAKVLMEEQERIKRRKLDLNPNLKSLFSSTGANGSTQKGGDFMTRGFSVPKRV